MIAVPRPIFDLMSISPRCVSIMRPTMARPSPFPWLSWCEDGGKCASLQFCAHAFAGVFEFHLRHVSAVHCCAAMNFVRIDGERAALGHGFGGIENQIQKGLFQLRGVAHDPRQIGLQSRIN